MDKVKLNIKDFEAYFDSIIQCFYLINLFKFDTNFWTKLKYWNQKSINLSSTTNFNFFLETFQFPRFSNNNIHLAFLILDNKMFKLTLQSIFSKNIHNSKIKINKINNLFIKFDKIECGLFERHPHKICIFRLILTNKYENM